jgi:hypothetical protein|tara:strand:+ start:1354 stop:1593 length:240 start_codon:yes stop_codon:yes gene_type:complete
MGKKKGRIKYCPFVVIDEIEDIKREDDITIDAEAMRKLVKYARVGRESKRMMSLDWSRSIPRIPVDPNIKRKKRKGSFF